MNEIQMEDDYMQGLKDAENGLLHRSGMSKYYDRGYSVGYANSAMADHNINQSWEKPEIKDLSFEEGRDKFQKAKEFNDVKK